MHSTQPPQLHLPRPTAPAPAPACPGGRERGRSGSSSGGLGAGGGGGESELELQRRRVGERRKMLIKLLEEVGSDWNSEVWNTNVRAAEAAGGGAV